MAAFVQALAIAHYPAFYGSLRNLCDELWDSLACFRSFMCDDLARIKLSAMGSRSEFLMSVLEAMRKTLAQLDREAEYSHDPALARIRDQMLHSIEQLELKHAETRP